MAFNADYFLNKTLGENFEDLLKTEIYKPGSRTTVDINDMKIGLQIVPRAIMGLLIRELSPMNIGETKEITIPVPLSTIMKVTKHERDSLSGEIIQENKKIAEFMHRSIPGIGLVLLSSLELYDIDNLSQEQTPSEDLTQKINRAIDERLSLHDLVGKVVDKKIQERDAIKELFMAKITQDLEEKQKIADGISNITKIQTEDPASRREPYFQGMANGLQVANAIVNDKDPQFVKLDKKKKQSPLKDFLASRKDKKPKEFAIDLVKGEHIFCPDCKKDIYNGQIFSNCICYGDDRNKKINIKKTEEGIKVRFGRGWDIENMEMLLEVLRSRK